MWYLKNKIILLILGFYMFVFEKENFVSKFLEMVKKIKTEVDKKDLVFKMKNSSILAKSIWTFIIIQNKK